MGVQYPSPQTTLLILLGASAWPYSTEFQSSEAFANAARRLKAYFLNPRLFGLPAEDLLDLFDSNHSPDELDVEIRQFLEQRVVAMRAAGNAARDVLLYFVGHGGFVGRDADFYLALRRTRMDNPRASGLQMLSLADTLTEKARHLRRIIILDCCFAAAAFSAFQAGPDQVALEKTSDAFEVRRKAVGFPTKGTALLCSSSHKSPSLLLPDGSSTMFTKALLDALVQGTTPQLDRLSLRDVRGLAADVLMEIRNAPRPIVHSPDQSEGDIADIPFFPNPQAEEERARQEAERLRRVEEERISQAEEEARVREAEQDRLRKLEEEAKARQAEEERVRKTEEQVRKAELEQAHQAREKQVVLPRKPFTSLNQIQKPKEQWLSDALALLEAEHYIETLAALDHALALDPDLAYAHNAKGLALYQLKRYPESLIALDRAVALNPNYAAAHYGRGLALEQLKRYADAFFAYEQVTRLDAGYTPAWCKKGDVLSELKRYEDALTAYEKALQLDRNDADAYIGKENALKYLGRTK
jgi:tetratricopeptide (TPR) repeat protein